MLLNGSLKVILIHLTFLNLWPMSCQSLTLSLFPISALWENTTLFLASMKLPLKNPYVSDIMWNGLFHLI